MYRIAYNVMVDEDADDYDVFIMGMDGTGPQNLTRNPDVAWTYAAGKERVYFISDRDTCRRCYFLYRMDTDGKNLQKISDLRLRDSWMSTRLQEREIIVNPHPDIDSAFYVIDQSGKILKKIPFPFPYASDPCFSPDGKKVVFRGGTKKSKREKGYEEELYLMNEDGTGLIQLTQYPSDDTTAPWYAYKAGPPRWNATGNFITYQSYQNGKYSLFAVSPDGHKQWKLTDLTYNEGWHDWSPDGQWLAIEIFNDEQTQFHIGLMNWQSRELSILTDTTYHYQQAPVFVRIAQ